LGGAILKGKIMKEHDIMRDRLLRKAGVTQTTLEDLKKSEWSPRFERLMRNRLIMGSFRYQPFEEKRAKPWTYDTASEAIERIKRYQKDGNTEHLVDAANMCLLEFEFGSHPLKHFESIDDGEHAKSK
jgi:hypothetical protein